VSCVIPNTDDYVALMKQRAAGALPEMGCALRVAELLQPTVRQLPAPELLDVGCATGHFRRVFLGRLPLARYTGLEIDPRMVAAGREVWAAEIAHGSMDFIVADLEQLDTDRTFDVVICVNAFMYFASAKRALAKMLRMTRHRLLVRSYFSDANYRIVRAQTTRNHDQSTVDEIDAFDDHGNMRSFDYWTIYSHSYIEALVLDLQPAARLEWIEDRNILTGMDEERRMGLSKRGATDVLDGHEISYPFFLPWKYLSIAVSNA